MIGSYSDSSLGIKGSHMTKQGCGLRKLQALQGHYYVVSARAGTAMQSSFQHRQRLATIGCDGVKRALCYFSALGAKDLD